jgi:hypothetical protein
MTPITTVITVTNYTLPKLLVSSSKVASNTNSESASLLTSRYVIGSLESAFSTSS